MNAPAQAPQHEWLREGPFFFASRMGTSIFLDESGDLGWQFHHPYGDGGSSRFFTLAAILVPDHKVYLVERIASGLYKKRKRAQKNELKSTNLSSVERCSVAKEVVALLGAHADIRVSAITVCKQACFDPFRRHPNGLYNYMVKLLLLRETSRHETVHFIPDARSIKTELKHALDDYLKTELAASGARTRLETTPWESRTCKALQVTDFLCSILWSQYEFSSSRAYPVLAPAASSSHLFFTSPQAPPPQKGEGGSVT